MIGLLYYWNQQSQVERLEMIFNIVVRLNIQFLGKKKCKHIPSIKHALDYISRIHEGLRNGLMEALWEF